MNDTPAGFTAEEIIRAMYEGLLRRRPDRTGLAMYVAGLESDRNLGKALRAMVSSEEFQRMRFANAWQWPNPAETYHNDAVVFLHIQKTAGTSLQHMLTDSFGKKNVFITINDTLHLHCPGELSTYSVITGHFNFDSIRYIPRQRPTVFTFVREPKRRLLSLYYYWRSHEPSHPAYPNGPETANRLSLKEFFASDAVVESYGLWNHMTWAIMGFEQWRELRSHFFGNGTKPTIKDLESEIRLLVRKQLQRFAFVGLQEEFEASVMELFTKLGRPMPAWQMHNVTQEIGVCNAHFKANFKKETPTPEVDAALDRLVALDQIVYDEAKRVYKKSSSQSPKTSMRDASKQETSM